MRLLNIQEAPARVMAASTARATDRARATQTRAFQIDAPGDVDGIAERIDGGQILDEGRHAADRSGEARQQRKRHDEQHRIEHRLLHGRRHGGHQQADADGGQQEQQQTDRERDVGAGKRDSEPQLGDQQHPGGLDRSDHHGRQGLPGHDLEWTKRCHQQLIEGALFSFARDRHRREHHGLQQRQGADHARYHEPACLEIGVVPGAGDHLYRRGRDAMIVTPVALNWSTMAEK